jgi:hypothetical protein
MSAGLADRLRIRRAIRRLKRFSSEVDTGSRNEARQIQDWSLGPDSARTEALDRKTFKTSRLSGPLVHMREFDVDELAQVVPLPQPESAAGLTGI